ncbi:UDP-galactopyranose mutase [Flammeovirgaceae bacterium 311]|nr:UDP-galactopyranose mutase [Flammeovirgaceae bacterium 311]
MYKDKLENPMPTSSGHNTTVSRRDAQQHQISNTQHKVTDQFVQNMPDVVCLSHLRWDFVYQRPQHLLSRFARHTRLYFVEEPIFEDISVPRLEVSGREQNIQLVVPHLPHGLSPEHVEMEQRQLLDRFFAEKGLDRYIFWYYTPMALGFTNHFRPVLTVYDCMDELSAFKFAPVRLKELEQELFKKADLVFTGGQSLYEAKQQQHTSVYAFPSSIDKAHFAQARQALEQPSDQASIAAPRIGFFGVIDERMDLELLTAVADAKPEWQLVMVGPVVKIDPADLPQRPNLHYLGGKSYKELPTYLSGWSVAMLPFAINESTRFISPTKTPEYLAAGKPVVSTPIRDVIRPYGEQNLVHIAGTAQEFITAIEKALAQQDDAQWKEEVDAFLTHISWDKTWQGMVELMSNALQLKTR